MKISKEELRKQLDVELDEAGMDILAQIQNVYFYRSMTVMGVTDTFATVMSVGGYKTFPENKD